LLALTEATGYNFDPFWEKVEKVRGSLTVDSSCLPRKHKVSKQCDTGSDQDEFHSTPKDLYRQVYFTLKF